MFINSFNTTSTTDPDGDQIFYKFDWGDGTDSGWIEQGEASHSWSVNDNYEIKVRAKDTNNYQSEWSDPLTVIITKKSKAITSPFINFLQQYPNLFSILQTLLQ